VAAGKAGARAELAAAGKRRTRAKLG